SRLPVSHRTQVAVSRQVNRFINEPYRAIGNQEIGAPFVEAAEAERRTVERCVLARDADNAVCVALNAHEGIQGVGVTCDGMSIALILRVRCPRIGSAPGRQFADIANPEGTSGPLLTSRSRHLPLSNSQRLAEPVANVSNLCAGVTAEHAGT